MGSDKRAILSSKRARGRRRRAAQKLANAQLHDVAVASPMPECDGGSPNIVVKAVLVEENRESVTSDKSTTQSEAEEEEEEEIDYDEEDELVFVCRPTMPDFCTDFIPAKNECAFARSKRTNSNAGGGSPDMKTFTVRLPAFRETRDGFITYTIALSTCAEPRKHFQLERRFSEFVAFATSLNQCLQLNHDGVYSRNSSDSIENEAKDDQQQQLSPCFQWELPPKTWFPVTQVPAIEERRSRLESCVEELLLQDDGKICRLPLVRDFFMLDIFGAQVAEEKQQQVHV